MGLLRDLRNVFHLAHEVTRLREEHEQLLAEWANTSQRFDRLLRQLTMRTTATRPDIEPEATNDKAALRRQARARGIL